MPRSASWPGQPRRGPPARESWSTESRGPAPHSAPRCGLRAALQGPPSLGRLYKLSPVGKPQRERAPHLPADPLGQATGSLGARACAASGRALSGPESAACLPHAGPPRDAADRDTRLLRDFQIFFFLSMYLNKPLIQDFRGKFMQEALNFLKLVPFKKKICFVHFFGRRAIIFSEKTL